MGFYIRKSLRAGPLRFNLSKSGIGVSAGVTGFRIGTGPRGNYVHLGRGGLYYRKTLTSNPNTSARRTTSHSSSNVSMAKIESADVLKLHDSSSAELLSEIRNKHKKIRILPITIIFSLFVWGLFSLAYFANILNRNTTQIQSFGNLFICAGYPFLLFLITGSVNFLAYRRDQLAKTVVLFYELEGHAETAYQSLHDAFQELINCSRKWHIQAQGNINTLHEWKTNAGASSLIDRKTIRLAFESPPYVNTNIAVPSILARGKSLYFFPDRILFYAKGNISAISYKDLQLNVSDARFIESQGVPLDAVTVDYTWRFVNKDGNPDRRFNNNRQLPIVVYSELYFTSQEGLNELFQVSKPGIGADLVSALRKLASDVRPQEHLPVDKLLRRAIEAIKSDDKKMAFQLLVQIIKANPKDKNAEKAWMWMSKVVNDPHRKRQCFEAVLELNPNNVMAKKALARFDLKA